MATMNPMIETVMLTADNIAEVAEKVGKTVEELQEAFDEHNGKNTVLFVAYLTEKAKDLITFRFEELLEASGRDAEEFEKALELELKLAAANRAEWARALMEE